MATNISSLDFALVVGTFGGVASFFRGFRTYRESRFLQDTPTTPIRSLAMGFVRIHGKAQSEQLVTSPVTHTPCCYYAVEIRKWERRTDSRSDSFETEGERGTWSHYGAEADGGWFYLEDSTGRVLVNPHGAEFDLEITGTREVGSLTPSVFATGAVSENELRAYVARMGVSPMIPGLHPMVGMGGTQLAISKYKKHEINSNELFQQMLGPQLMQMRTQMHDALEAEGPQSDPRVEEVRLAQIELGNYAFWDPKYEELRRRIVRMQARNKKLGLFGTAALPQPNPPSSDLAPAVPDTPATEPSLAAAPPFSSDQPLASGRYRLMEFCILPDHDYDISGTCAQNPGAKDLDDRNLIRRGVNERTYVISGMARKDVNTMMQMRSQLMIFGGGMVAVFCLGLLLFRFGAF
jgi:hypothetical protein